MRLDKFLSNAGVFSRKDAGIAARKGRVSVDGAVTKDAGAEVSASAVVTADGCVVKSGENIVLAMNKPAGYVSATEDKRDKTVMELLPYPYRNMPLSIVGRLDKDTEGLLLFTTDGQFLHVVTSPKSNVEKTYFLQTDAPFLPDDADKIAAGVSIGEGETVRGKLNILSDCSAELTISEGKFHQIKRMIFALSKNVVYLKRVRIGALLLSDLNLGAGEVSVVEKSQVLQNK